MEEPGWTLLTGKGLVLYGLLTAPAVLTNWESLKLVRGGGCLGVKGELSED